MQKCKSKCEYGKWQIKTIKGETHYLGQCKRCGMWQGRAKAPK